MKWYEIILMVIIFIFAIYLGIKAKDFNKNKYHNDKKYFIEILLNLY